MNQRDAGEFAGWVAAFRAACAEGRSVNVPCGSCIACCESGQLIPVEPDETDALAHISTDSLVPIPDRPGTYALRHDASGRCSQLVAGRCSIYPHRPRACRAYDCRIFPAAGIHPDKPLIATAASEWHFTYASKDSRRRHDDVRAAAVLLGFPGGLTAPASPTQHALAAIEVADELRSTSRASD